MSDELTHFDAAGRAQMVDVGAKSHTERVAMAIAQVRLEPETLGLVASGSPKKGDVLGVARVAGIMGSKRTSDLIPLCHPVPLTQATVEFALDRDRVWIRATARCVGQTGVEMEALTAASVAALTIYDMCKAVDRSMSIGPVFVLTKSGGASGDFVNTRRTDLPSEDLAWR